MQPVATRARLTGLEVLVLCVGNAIGGGSSAAVPLWVAAIIKAGSLTASQVGLLASGQALSMAVGIVGLAAFGRTLQPRWVAAIAAMVALLSNLIAMIGTFETLIIGRLSSGLATGVLLATVTQVAARRPNAQRVLALMELTTVLLVSLVYFTSPGLIERFGVAGLFALLAFGAALVAMAALLRFPAIVLVKAESTRASSIFKLAPMVGSLALAVACVGQSTVSTYIVVIGNGLGLNSRTIGTVLAIAFPIVIMGPVAAYILGERIGLLRPLLLGFFLLAVDSVLLAHANSAILFCFCAAGLNLWLTFCGPYAIALLGRLDPSGRFASAAPAIVMVGAAVGSALGSKLIGGHTFAPITTAAALSILLGIGLFAIAARVGKLES